VGRARAGTRPWLGLWWPPRLARARRLPGSETRRLRQRVRCASAAAQRRPRPAGAADVCRVCYGRRERARARTRPGRAGRGRGGRLRRTVPRCRARLVPAASHRPARHRDQYSTCPTFRPAAAHRHWSARPPRAQVARQRRRVDGDSKPPVDGSGGGGGRPRRPGRPGRCGPRQPPGRRPVTYSPTKVTRAARNRSWSAAPAAELLPP
jgi:hypothetical protein